jgi:hypothetical protein
MKRDNDFYYFLSFITFYTIMLIWYTYYIVNYDNAVVPTYTSRGLDEYAYVVFIYKVILAFPFGIMNWLKDSSLNVVYYFFGSVFYSFLLYRVFYRKVSNLLWFMLLLNILATIFLMSFLLENPVIIGETYEDF